MESQDPVHDLSFCPLQELRHFGSIFRKRHDSESKKRISGKTSTPGKKRKRSHGDQPDTSNVFEDEAQRECMQLIIAALADDRLRIKTLQVTHSILSHSAITWLDVPFATHRNGTIIKPFSAINSHILPQRLPILHTVELFLSWSLRPSTHARTIQEQITPKA